MSGNSVTASTIFTSNNVQGGPNDVVVNNETVQGDLVVEGSFDIGNATINGLDVEGSAQVKGDLTVGYGGAASNIIASGNISGNTLSITGVAQFNSAANANSLIVAEDAQIGGILTTPFLQVDGLNTSTNFLLNGDGNVGGTLNTENLFVDTTVSAGVSAYPTITVTNFSSSSVTSGGSVIARFTTPLTVSPTVYVELNNINVTFGYDNLTVYYQGLSGIAQREVLIGLVQSPWNNVVDNRFNFFKYFRKQWNWNYNALTPPYWTQTVANETYTGNYIKTIALSGNTTYDVVVVAPNIPNINGIFTVDSDNNTPLPYEYYFNSVTNTIQLRIGAPYLELRYPASVSVGIAPATPSNLPFVESTIGTTSVSGGYRYYNLIAPYSPQYSVQDEWTPVKIYSRNRGILSANSTLNISLNLKSVEQVASNNIVQTGKFYNGAGLNVDTGITSTSTTTGSIITNGGVGIGGELTGFTERLTGNVTSTSTTTGTLRVAGGAGITGNVYSNAMYSNVFRTQVFPNVTGQNQFISLLQADNLDNDVNGTLSGGVYGITAFNTAANPRIFAVGYDSSSTNSTIYIGGSGSGGSNPDYYAAMKNSGEVCLYTYNAGSSNVIIPDFTDRLTVRGTTRLDGATTITGNAQIDGVTTFNSPISLNYFPSVAGTVDKMGFSAQITSSTVPGSSHTALCSVNLTQGVYFFEGATEYSSSTSTRLISITTTGSYDFTKSNAQHSVNGVWALQVTTFITVNAFTTITLLGLCSSGVPTGVSNILRYWRVA